MTTTTAPAALPELIALPLLCGPAGNLARGGDMNIDWTCKRAAQIYMLHTWADNITASRARIATRRSPVRARNLTNYVIEETARFNRIAGSILTSLDPCGHDLAARRELSPADALPDCTC